MGGGYSNAGVKIKYVCLSCGSEVKGTKCGKCGSNMKKPQF
jgi:DNA-directed RNA polymerase subunit RPC12/RpoP